jgi:hypothetical protein
MQLPQPPLACGTIRRWTTSGRTNETTGQANHPQGGPSKRDMVTSMGQPPCRLPRERRKEEEPCRWFSPPMPLNCSRDIVAAIARTAPRKTRGEPWPFRCWATAACTMAKKQERKPGAEGARVHLGPSVPGGHTENWRQPWFFCGEHAPSCSGV